MNTDAGPDALQRLASARMRLAAGQKPRSVEFSQWTARRLPDDGVHIEAGNTPESWRMSLLIWGLYGAFLTLLVLALVGAGQ